MQSFTKTIFVFLFSCVLNAQAQTFPFIEGFHGVPSNTLPADWTGDMKVLSYHGLNDEKGLTSDMSSVDMNDTAVTPWVGPMAASTEFVFWYRIVDQFIYPSTEKHLLGNDQLKLEVSTDDITYNPIFVADSSNHQATLNFKKVTLYLTQFASQNVKFRFVTRYGMGSSYFVDIDSIKIRAGVNPNGISEALNGVLSLFPNPAHSQFTLDMPEWRNSGIERITVTDILGKEIAQRIATPTMVQFDTRDWPSGIYFVQVQTADVTLTKKLMVNHP